MPAPQAAPISEATQAAIAASPIADMLPQDGLPF